MIMKDKANRIALRGVSAAFVISAAMLFVGGCGNSDPYMVIDISTGADGGKYPVSYMREAPQGGWGDEYKTTKIVLRRIEPGVFDMGSPDEERGRRKKPKKISEKKHQVTISKPYYMGVFEVTQRQWELVMGTRPSAFCRNDSYEKRPVENVSYDMIRGDKDGKLWPLSSAVDAKSFIGLLRTKTGKDGIDLPTEAQWEYACRAGCKSALNLGIELKRIVKDGEISNDYKLTSLLTNVSDIARCDAKDIKKPEKKNWRSPFVFERAGVYGDELGVYDTKKGTAVVGSFPANAWGLYDMIGNVGEWCLDAISPYGDAAVTDPIGGENDLVSESRIVRGGGWHTNIELCRSASRNSGSPDMEYHDVGLRLCFMPELIIPSKVITIPATKKIIKLKGLTLGETLPYDLKESMKFDDDNKRDGVKYGTYDVDADDLSDSLKSFFIKPDWLLNIRAEVLPGSKEVYDLQIKYAAEDEEEANAKTDAIAKLIESELGVQLKKQDGHRYAYGNKDNWVKVMVGSHLISKLENGVRRVHFAMVTIHDEALIKQLKEEAEAKNPKKSGPRSLVQILGISPEEQEDGKVKHFSGIFGYKFGSFVNSSKKNNIKSVVKTFDVKGEPFGFKEGVLFGTPKTRKLYKVRVVYAQADIKGAYANARKLIEDAIGTPMKKGVAKTHVCWTKFSSKALSEEKPHEFMFEVIETDDSDRVFIDITDTTLQDSVDDENGGDAFGFIPTIKKGSSVEKVNGVFGYEFGMSLADKETETNDSGALVYTINQEDNELGFEQFKLFASAKDKKVYMIRGIYDGLSSEEKAEEWVMTLKRSLGRTPNKDDDGNYFFFVPGGEQGVLIEVDRQGTIVLLDVTDIAGYKAVHKE